MEFKELINLIVECLTPNDKACDIIAALWR